MKWLDEWREEVVRYRRVPVINKGLLIEAVLLVILMCIILFMEGV